MHDRGFFNFLFRSAILLLNKMIYEIFFIAGVANTMLTDLLARCPQCGKLFKGPRSTLALQEHITNIHAPTSLQSKFLPASSSPTNSVASAITQDDPDKPYVCIKCKASFMHKDHLEKHEQLHSTQGQVSKFLEYFQILLPLITHASLTLQNALFYLFTFYWMQLLLFILVYL